MVLQVLDCRDPLSTRCVGAQGEFRGLDQVLEDRKCSACRQEFKSKGGLISHQSRTTNPLCRRAGKIRMGSERGKKAKNRFWEKKKVFQLKDSLFSKHSRGKAISKEEKFRFEIGL